MGFQGDIRKQQLLDKINVIRTITPEVEESAVEPISKSIFDEFEGADVTAIEKSLTTIGSLLGDEEVNDIEKAIGHKYFKREGTKGGYKYYYTEAEYKESKGNGNNYPQASMQDEGEDIQEKVKERLAAKKKLEEERAYDKTNEGLGEKEEKVKESYDKFMKQAHDAAKSGDTEGEERFVKMARELKKDYPDKKEEKREDKHPVFNHHNFNQKDYEFFHNKGWDDNKILEYFKNAEMKNYK